MRRSLFALAIVGSLAWAGSASAATLLTIDGTRAGDVRSVEGGDPRAEIVTTTLADGTVAKQPGSVTYAPLTIRVLFPPAAPVLAWVGQLASGQLPRKTIQITDVSATGSSTTTEFAGAMLVEAQLPAFDAGSTTPSELTLVVQVEQSSTVTAAAGTTAAARTTAGTFRLDIGGLDGSGVMRIEPLTIRLRTASDALGAQRTPTASPATLELSNLVVTLSEAKSATWRAWFNDFVVNGNSDPAHEKSGSLQFLDGTGKTVVDQLNFSQLGIVRLSKVGGAVATNQAELYFERGSTGTPPTSSSQPLTSSGTTSGVTSGRLAAASANASRTPLTGTVTATTPSAIVTATSTTNPADSGTRDPAQFPRVSGLTRVDYSGTFQPNFTNEQATYTAAESITQLVPRVDAAARAGGWTMATLQEDTTPNGKVVNESWTKGGASASLSFGELSGGAGTRLGLQVYVQLGQ